MLIQHINKTIKNKFCIKNKVINVKSLSVAIFPTTAILFRKCSLLQYAL